VRELTAWRCHGVTCTACCCRSLEMEILILMGEVGATSNEATVGGASL